MSPAVTEPSRVSFTYADGDRTVTMDGWLRDDDRVVFNERSRVPRPTTGPG